MNTNYILIQNDGEIELGAFELIGASTKRNQEGKIGFFGSGLKYSIAYMMRTGIDFRIFSGEKELLFSRKEEKLRDQVFDRICINGVPTSYTTAMGPTWNESWFVVREIYCNALDEPNCQIVKSTSIVNASAGKTRIYIRLTKELESMINNWDSYFSSDRTNIFECFCYTSGIGLNDIGGKTRQNVKVFNKTQGVIYHKGVRVFAGKTYMYDYELEFADINEDRTLKSSSYSDYMVCAMIGMLINKDYTLNVLRQGKEEGKCFEYDALKYSKPNDGISDKWVRFGKEYLLVVSDVSGKYVDKIMNSHLEWLPIPVSLAKEIKKAYPQIQILGLDKSSGDIFMSDIEVTSKIKYLLKEVLSSLSEMKYQVSYPISIVHFEDTTILGHADIKESQIYLAEKLFDLGRREIALCIIEENEHIKSGFGDETRAFQNHLFSMLLKQMEEAAALFL